MDTSRARRHHYTFAHTVLRNSAFAAPDLLLAAALRGTLDDELSALWRWTGSGLPPAERWSGEGLTGRLVDHESVLVTLPPALYPFEAHFVLISAPLRGPVGYATLEEALDLEDQPATMLCLWAMTADGPAHARTLQFLPAREDRFLDAARGLPSVPPTLALS